MNSISVSGNLGKDAELRSMPDGTQILSFSVADSQGKDKSSIWWNCSLFGKRAASLQQYLAKGQQVTVNGNITEREWSDKDGQPRKSMEIRVNDIALQGGKREAAPVATPRAAAPRQAQSVPSGFDSADDDIPY